MVIGAIDPALAAVLVALVAPLATYLVAVRQLSGRIKNSDATQLWEESRSIRDWSAARMKELNEHIERLENRVEELETANRALTEENLHYAGLLEIERAMVARLKLEAQHQFGPHIDLSPDPKVEGEINDP